MKTIQQIQDFCKSVNLNPKRIFIASNGAIMTEWHSQKQALRFNKAFDKHLNSKGSVNVGPNDIDATGTDLEDWEQIAYAEMLAPRH